VYDLLAGIGIKIQGHLKIIEYKNQKDYLEQRPNRILLNKRNAVHKDNASIIIANVITNQPLSSIAYMVFGNGGTSVGVSGQVQFLTPNDTGIGADLYNPVFFQLVDDTIGASPGNQMAIRHISGSQFTDADIRCTIGVNQPFGQLPTNTAQNINLDSTFAFDEISLKLIDGTLLTHVIFSPVLKTASSILEVIYTLRIFVEQPEIPPHLVFINGVETTTELGEFSFNYHINSARFNDSPYIINVPTGPVNGSQGSLSLWVKGTNIFNMAHDSGPSLFSSGNRQTMEISGRGYIRRQPTAITRDNPCQITIPNHGLSSGDVVEFTHVIGGCSELEGLSEVITFIDTNNFTIGVDSSSFASAYTGPAQITLINPNRPEFNTMKIIFRDNDSNPTKIFYWNSAESIPSDQWVNLLISWDLNQAAASKILQVFVNDTEWNSTSDPTYRYDPDGPFSIEYTSSPTWVIGEPVTIQNYANFTQITREILRSVS
jgi:hypothetical protein